MILIETLYWLRRLCRAVDEPSVDENGQDLVEYALLMGALSIVSLAIILLVAPSLDDALMHVVNGLQSA